MLVKTDFRNTQDHVLSGILSVPSDSKNNVCVVILTGYPHCKDNAKYRDLQSCLDGMGLASFCFDYSGLGESEGRFEELNMTQAIDDTHSALSFLESKGYKTFYILGVSFGACVAIQVAYKNDTVRKLCLVCPVIDFLDQKLMTKTKQEFQRWATQGYIESIDEKQIKRKISYSFFEDLMKYPGYSSIYELDKKISIQIVHGTKDKKVPIELSIKISKICPNLELEIIEQGDHELQDPRSMAILLKLIEKYFNL
jgi:uncharacterized protein